MSVTTTSLRQGKFETRFWHKVFEEEVGRVKGHFGPVNTYAQSLDPCDKPTDSLVIELPCIQPGRLMHPEVKTDLFECIISTSRISERSHMEIL